MALNVKPLGDRILVEPVEEKETKKGGIIIPDTAKEKPMESMVVALGTGKTDDNGKKVPFEVKKGDRVPSANMAAPKSNWMAKNTRSFTEGREMLTEAGQSPFALERQRRLRLVQRAAILDVD